MNRPYDWESRDLEEVSGIINDRKELEALLDDLEQRNLRNDVSVLMTDQTRNYYDESWGSDVFEPEPDERIEHSSKLPEGAATGGLTGGILGAIIGGLTLVGSVLVPGVGLLVAGPLVGAITGGAIGTAAGGLVGALIGAGIPEEEARFYEHSLQEQGNVLVVAHVPQNQVAEVRTLFGRHGARSVRVS